MILITNNAWAAIAGRTITNDYRWMLQIQRLEGFYWVAKAGGYAKAARAFPYPITQPGVHAQVRKLEEEIGVALFERVAKDQMVPTRAGRALFEFCAPFLEALPGVVRSLRDDDAGGELRVDAGALETVALLPGWLRRLRTARPDIRVRVHEVHSPDYGRLVRGETDLVLEVQPELPRGVAGEVVGTHRAFLAVPNGHRLTKKKRPLPRDLEGEPFVAFDDGTRQQALQLAPFLAAGIEADVVATASSVAAILALVGAGIGASLVVWPTTRPPKVAGATLLALRGEGTTFPVTAAFRASAVRDRLVSAALAYATSRS